jgi:hypothetical protein
MTARNGLVAYPRRMNSGLPLAEPRSRLVGSNDGVIDASSKRSDEPGSGDPAEGTSTERAGQSAASRAAAAESTDGIVTHGPGFTAARAHPEISRGSIS